MPSQFPAGVGKAVLLAAVVVLAVLSSDVSADVVSNVNLTALKGQELRVFYNVNPPSVTLNQDGTYGGYLVDLLNQAALEGGFTLKSVNLSAVATAESTVPWVACPIDSAAGRLDLCLGTWWETPARRQMTAFTSSVFPATFMLVVQSSTSSGGGFARVFYPFEWELWGLLAASIAVVSVLLYMVEYQHSEDFEADWSKPYGSFVSVFLGYAGFLQAGPMHSPRTMAGRLMVLGYAFLVLVGVASYTANLAASLTVANSKVGFNSIVDIQEAGGSVCLSPDVHGSMKGKYSLTLTTVTRSIDAARAILAPLTGVDDPEDEGKSCDGGVVYLEEYENLQAGDLCYTKVVGKPLFNIPVAFPCAPWVEPVLSYFITSHRTNGDIDAWMPPVADKCANVTSALVSERLSVAQMEGAFGVFAVLCGAGVVLAVVQQVIAGVSKGKSWAPVSGFRKGGGGGSVVAPDPNNEADVELSGDVAGMLRAMSNTLQQVALEVRQLKADNARLSQALGGSLATQQQQQPNGPAWVSPEK